MKYFDLKCFLGQWKGSICIFGAGLIGCTWAYDLLVAMGIRINFYCDNNKKAGSEIKEGIKTISLKELYSLKDKVLVFVAIMDKYQHSVAVQLKKEGILYIVGMDYFFLQTFIESVLEIDDQEIKEQFRAIIDDAEYLRRKFKFRIGYDLNLSNPRTFNEKLQWLKLYDRNPEYTRLVNKNEVKQFVEWKIGSQYIIPTLGIWNTFDDIDFGKLPEQFVLKCTHDSGSVIFCKDKRKLNLEIVRNTLNTKLKINFFWIGREWPYKNIKPQIIAEDYLENKNGEEIIDYKFLCANGQVYYIFTCSGRNSETGLCVNFYDRNWNALPFERHYPKREKEIKKPNQLLRMIDLAEKLAYGLKFVRVDFYIVNNYIYFSELTFYPGDGMEEFTPVEWDYKLGDIIKL